MSKKRVDNKGRVLPPNIIQYKDGRYVWRKMINGEKYLLVDNNLVELKKKVIQKEAEIASGTCRDLGRETLNEWFSKWLTIYKCSIRETTLNNYRSYWKWYVEGSKLGNTKLSKLNRTMIIQFYNYLCNEKHLSGGTIRYINSLIFGSLEDARLERLLPDNPAEGVLAKIKVSGNKQREALTLQEQEKFINYIANSNIYNVYLPLISFLLGTGCRIGEALGMTWDNIDFTKGLIYVNHTISYRAIDGVHKFYITEPKTSSGCREIPMLEDVRKQLIKQQEYQSYFHIPNDISVDGYSNFVFTTSTGRPYTQESVNRVIRNVIKEINVNEELQAQKEDRSPIILPRFSAHTLRHTFCTRFCENESNVKVIQQVMGHSRIDVTLGIYAHATQDKVGEVMNNLNGKIKLT